MKFPTLTSTLARAGVALGLTLALALPAQTPPPDEAPPPPAVPAAPAAEPAPEPGAEPAAPPTPDTELESTDGLRRLDEPPSPDAERSKAEAPAPPETPSAPRRYQAGEVVRFFMDALLPAGESAREVVAIIGSVVADGDVSGSAVAIMGDTTVNGSAQEAVAVLGSVIVNGHVRGEVVAVMGNVQLGPNAVVEGEIVSVGGRVDRAPGSVTHSGVQQIGPFPIVSEGLDGLRVWFRTCLALGRPLAFDHRVLWAWGIALAFIGVYLFIALLFNRSVITCAQTLEERPGLTVVTAIITAFLAPILTILLSFIGIGLLLIPLFFLAGLYGKTAFLAWLGRRATLALGWTHSFPAVVIGSVILLLLYTVPFLGFLMMKVTSALGLGMVVYTIILTGRQSPPQVATPGTPGVSPVAPAGAPAPAPNAVNPAMATAASAAMAASPGPVTAATPVGDTGVPPPMPTSAPMPASAPPPVGAVPATAAAPSYGPAPAVPPVLPATYATLPRAGFWLRLGASLLDVVVVAIVLGMVGLREYLPVIFAAYCVVLWTLRATTIGGIICGLKVVRLDERRLDWSIAIVRALGGFLSLAVLGLGFIWVAFDKERQSWHDKIAGTVVVRVPKGVTLV